MAKPAVRSVERHARDAAPLAADCRQGAPRADAVDQSLVARAVLSDGERPYYIADTIRRAAFPVRLRFHRPAAGPADERRAARVVRAGAAAGGAVLCACHGDA